MSLGWVGAEGLNVIDFQGQQASEQWAYCSKVWPYCVNNPTGRSTFILEDPRAEAHVTLFYQQHAHSSESATTASSSFQSL